MAVNGLSAAELAAQPLTPAFQEPKPLWLKYPDARTTVRLGEGVYFYPAVQTQTQSQTDSAEAYEDYLTLAQTVVNCFAGDGKDVELEDQFCRDIWDSSPPEFEFIRSDWAANEMCSILERTPTAGLGCGDVEREANVWELARQVLLGDMVGRCNTKGLTFTVAPPLPEGVHIAEMTGVISGHPSEPCPRQTHTLTASSSSGEASCEIQFEVIDASPPSDLCYRSVDKSYLAGQPMVLIPKVNGIVSTWSVRPTLPRGLRIDMSTGTISGIPNETCAETIWTVIAKNDLGTTSTKLTFSVMRAPPHGLKYHADSDCTGVERQGFCGRQAVLTFPVQRPLCLRPTVDGEVETWDVKPALPEGVQLDVGTGMINGTPVNEKAVSPYTVTASNESGSTKVTVSFGVKLLPTISVGYNGFDDLYCVGEFLDIEPQVQGGATQWTVEPELPSTIKLHPMTGAIYGYCKDPVDETSYTITASNEAGGTSTVVTFAIIALPPEGLDYSRQVPEYAIGDQVSMEPDLLCGWGFVDFAIDPELPPGISIDRDSGVISGSPMAVAELTDYEVIAQNCQGSTTCTISFRVIKSHQEADAAASTRVPFQRLASGYLPSQLVRSTTKTQSNEADFVESNYKMVRKESRLSLKGGKIIDAALMVLPEVPETEDDDIEDFSEMVEAFDEASKFASDLQNIENVADLPPEPCKARQEWEWMLWTVHRTWLNDPTLTSLSFKGLDIPIPEVEPRIGQKLFQALTKNKYVVNLDLANSNLKSSHAQLLTDVLKKNTTIQSLHLDGNSFDSDSLAVFAGSLMSNPNSRIATLCCREMHNGMVEFGREVDKIMSEMMHANQRIVKFTYECKDLHFQSVIDRALKRNMDSARREVKARNHGPKPTQNGAKKAGERDLVSLKLVGRPAGMAAGVFCDNSKLDLVRHFTAEKKKMPTNQQLQMMAKNLNQALKYSEVAPLTREFRTKLLDFFVDMDVSVEDNTRKKCAGQLRSWQEKNNRWTVEITTGPNEYYAFISSKDPIIEISAEIAEWMALAE